MFTTQVPAVVLDVTAPDPSVADTDSARHEPPLFPEAQNCAVAPKVPKRVNEAPPLLPTSRVRQLFIVQAALDAAWAVKLPVTGFCA
jgi:hypothetical protein